MITNILPLVLVTLSEILTGSTAKLIGTNVKDQLSRFKEQKNREELVKIVKSLNGDTELDYYERAKKQGGNDHKEIHKMAELLKEIRFKENVETAQPETGVRINLIKNPEVLDRYVKMLRKDSSTSSDSDSNSDGDRRHGNEAIDVRRNAMFRIGASSEDEDNGILNDDTNKKAKFLSMEYQVTPFKSRDSTEERDQDKTKMISGLDSLPSKTKRFHVKFKADLVNKETIKEKSDIEEKFEVKDNIKSDEKSYNDADKQSKEANNDDKVDSLNVTGDKNKEKSDEEVDNDPWDRRKERKRKSEEANIDKWDEPNKKLEDNIDERDPRDRPKKRNKDVIRSEEKFENDYQDQPRKKKLRDNDDLYVDEPKKEKKNKWDVADRGNTNKNGWGTTKKKKDSRSNKDWDNQERNWKNSNDFDDNMRERTTRWEKRKREESKIQENDWRPSKNKESDNNWDKVGRDWDKGEDYSRKTSRNSWTKKKRDDFYEKPSYVAKNPEYHRYKGREGSSFQGRTPIPFIGKRGIYDDK